MGECRALCVGRPQAATHSVRSLTHVEREDRQQDVRAVSGEGLKHSTLVDSPAHLMTLIEALASP
jgi:hypothetical protein